MEKRELRKQMREAKTRLSENEKYFWSTMIFSKIEQMEAFNKAKTVLCYWSFDDEVNTHDFIMRWYDKKQILLPVIHGDVLILKVFTGFKNMVREQRFGVLEPLGDEFKRIDMIDFAVIPGLAFDRQNNRLGRGKGFYDRLLREIRGTKIGVAFSLQVHDLVPIEDHDEKVDLVVSEK